MGSKSLFLSLVFMGLMACLYAQPPQAFKYQAVARDNANALLAGQDIGVRFRIIKTSTAGTVVYTETHQTTTGETGLFSLEVGTGTVAGGSFSSINWGDDSYFLEVAIDITGGTAYQVMGTSQMLSVPYSLYAGEAGNGTPWGQQGSNLYYTSGNVGIGALASDDPLKVVNISDQNNATAIRAELAGLDGNIYQSAVYGLLWNPGSTFADQYNAAVKGVAAYTTGNGAGVIGESNAEDGFGVYGRALSITGYNYGIKGYTSSPDGYAGFFQGGRNYFGGNVGIGIADPAYKLHVSGTVSATSYLGDGSQLTGIPGDHLGNHTATENLKLGSYRISSDGDNEGIFIKPNGSVGINTADPQYTLDISGTSRVYGDFTLQNATPIIHFKNSSNADVGSIQMGFGLLVNTDNTYLKLKSGLCGVHTYSPESELHVYGDNPDLRLESSASAGNFNLQFYKGTTFRGSVGYSLTDNYLYLYEDGNVIVQNGRLGVGVIPVEEAHIKGSNPNIRLETTSSAGNYTLEFIQNNVFRGSVGYSLTNNYLFLYEDGSVIVQNGNLGIGVTPASQKIQVLGGAYCTGSSWVNSSDKNMKENFKPVNGAEVLEKLAAIAITSWNYKEEEEAVRHIGPVAQDFHAQFGLGNDDVSISTIDADGVSLAAIQELYRQNQEMKALIVELQGRLEDLENQ